jgi:serine phosphatase RsbU (regulator of sigma subunit)/PAS domain-containing protein
MAEVLLLDVGEDQLSALDGLSDPPEGPTVRAVRRGMQPDPSPEGRVVLVGASETLLNSVQWAHSVLPDARIAILASDLDHERVRELVRFAPGVPLDLELLDPCSPDLGARVTELCSAVGRARDYRDVLSSYRSGRGAGRGEERTPSQVLLGTLLEHAPIGVAVVDRRQRLLGWNRAASTLLGCGPALMGRPVGALFATPAPVESLITAAATGSVTHEALQVTVIGPEDRHLDIEAATSSTEDGREVVILLVQDASRRLLVESERDKYGAHVDMLVGLSESLLSAPDPDTALRQLGVELTMSFCDWVTFQAYDARGATARVVVEHRDPERVADVARAMRLLPRGVSEHTPSRRIARGEGPILMPVITEEMKQAYVPGPEVRAVVDRLGTESAIAVPMAGSSGVLGSMVLIRGPGSRRFDDSDLKVGVEVGRRAGLVFEVLEANRRQRLLTEELQRSMLTDPPVLDFAEVAARYVPAADEAQVGGDWYDSFLRADGALMVTVGDVVGHDIRSAAAMGQVRGLLRGIGYSYSGGPAEVAAALDAAVQSLHPGITATTVVASLDPDESEPGAMRMCWTAAGHPYPVVIRAAGGCEVLEGSSDLLLGVLPEAERTEQDVLLHSGDTVLLYSDGLIERRGQDLDEGLDALLEAAAELEDIRPGAVCDHLLSSLLGTEQEDDVCLIAFRLS